MTTQLLIYEKAVPVNSQRHGDWSVKIGADFGFARQVNAVPLMAAEFPAAAAEYPVVFMGTDSVMPAILLGAREKENLYVKEDGSWDGRYVPAFVRRYPFVFARSDDGRTFTLCIDEDFAGCNQEGRGERLFDADGERTGYLGSVLEFLQAYQAQFLRTEAFCKRLKELELLEPMRAQFALQSGETLGLTGFSSINRDKLKALPANTLADLAKTDELELAYLALQSLRNIQAMAQRLSPQTKLEGVPASEPEPSAPESESDKGNGSHKDDA